MEPHPEQENQCVLGHLSIRTYSQLCTEGGVWVGGAWGEIQTHQQTTCVTGLNLPFFAKPYPSLVTLPYSMGRPYKQRRQSQDSLPIIRHHLQQSEEIFVSYFREKRKYIFAKMSGKCETKCLCRPYFYLQHMNNHLLALLVTFCQPRLTLQINIYILI